MNIVEPVVRGVNCGIILFGETGSGKTKSFDDIVVLAFQHILNTLESKLAEVRNLNWECRVEYDRSCNGIVTLAL